MQVNAREKNRNINCGFSFNHNIFLFQKPDGCPVYLTG